RCDRAPRRRHRRRRRRCAEARRPLRRSVVRGRRPRRARLRVVANRRREARARRGDTVRLPRVEHGHRWREKLLIGFVRLATGQRTTDIVRTMLYRPEMFGRYARRWTHDVMRGPSAWTVGERELFAALTSRLNRCRY